MIDDYIDRGYWDELSIPDILRQNAERYPDKEAVVDSKTRLTWAELEESTNRVAVGLLKSGLKRDQSIVAQLPSSETSLLLVLACHRAGILCCFSPMTFRYNELKHVARTIKAVAVVTPWEYRGVNYFNMAREIARDVPELTLFLVTDNDVPQGARSFRSLCEGPFERDIHEEYLRGKAFSPFEVSAFALSSGTTGMPKCIEHTGAAAFDASLAMETEQRFNCKVLIAGGSMETFSFAQSGVDDPQEKRLRTLGKPFPGNEIKIVDDDGRKVPVGQIGQLLVRGRQQVQAIMVMWTQLSRRGE